MSAVLLMPQGIVGGFHARPSPEALDPNPSAFVHVGVERAESRTGAPRTDKRATLRLAHGKSCNGVESDPRRDVTGKANALVAFGGG